MKNNIIKILTVLMLATGMNLNAQIAANSGANSFNRVLISNQTGSDIEFKTYA